MKKMKYTYLAFSLMFTTWVLASIVDVNMHNLTTMNYANWNIFNILF